MTTLTCIRVDEAAARRDLRRQIARLEGRLQDRAPGIAGGGPRLLGLGELSAIRDALLAAEAHERAARAQEGDAIERARRRLEDAAADPRGHKGLRLPLAALGQPGCGVYRVRPRLGLIGMLAGWWELTLSSGCP